MTENEMLAYIAGIVDGEGCFCMTERSDQNRVTAQITIVNTYKELLDLISSFFAAYNIRCWISNMTITNAEWAQSFVLTIRHKESLLKLCSLIKPYLVVKANQCSLMMAYLNIYFYAGRGSRMYDEEQKALMQANKTLNQKGDLCKFVKEKIRSNVNEKTNGSDG